MSIVVCGPQLFSLHLDLFPQVGEDGAIALFGLII